MTTGREFIQTWFQRVWKENDEKAIYEILAGGEVRGLGVQTILSPDDFKIFKCAMYKLLSDIDITIDKCIEEGVWTSALCSLSAKSIATGEKVAITGNVWVRIEDGKIQEAYNHFDFMGLWSQLGYLPSDCFEQGLKGCKVV